MSSQGLMLKNAVHITCTWVGKGILTLKKNGFGKYKTTRRIIK